MTVTLETPMDIYDAEPQRPLKTGRGLLAKYGPAPSAEEIDANRREMFSGFALDASNFRYQWFFSTPMAFQRIESGQLSCANDV